MHNFILMHTLRLGFHKNQRSLAVSVAVDEVEVRAIGLPAQAVLPRL